MKLLTTKNTKIMKGRDKGYIIFGCHLLPGKTCGRASSGCLKSCLNTSGRGAMKNVQFARARKTAFFWNDLFGFLDQLHFEIDKAVKKAEKLNLTPAFRLNLTSDIPWECYGVPQNWPNVQFFDYSKFHDRYPPNNYHLTFSKSESNAKLARHWLDRGGNVAIVFDNVPSEYWGYKVISGDEDDLRFLDPDNIIVGLKAKGRAKKDNSGFVIRLPLAS
jgi:hypothetical protein